MESASIDGRISALRKQKGVTQEVLAQATHVTNQAASKWEADASQS